MQDKIWFVLEKDKVTGPFSVVEMQSFLNDKDKSNFNFWGKGQTEWVPYDKWQETLKELEQQNSFYKQHIERVWKILNTKTQEESVGNHNQMIAYLKTQKDLSQIQIWTEGYTEWKEVFQIHKIMDELGVSRRAHPRVPIMGTASYERANGESADAKILTISEGGIGAIGVVNLLIGDKVKLILKSPNLYTNVHATAEVVYVGTNDYAGFKFTGLPSESKSAIVEYVKKFADSNA